mgnify:FL=1
MSNQVITTRQTDEPARRLELAERYRNVREFSETIAAPLAPEDCVIQSMPDVSPTRWHLAHTTWFFETFLLKERPDFEPYDPSFDFLFNSYYNTLGEQFPRHRRGLLSRPTVDQVLQFRKHVDQRVLACIELGSLTDREWMIIEIGLNHEQQHQELMLTDIKHVLSCNPLAPRYSDGAIAKIPAAGASRLVHFPGGLRSIGHEGQGFAYDNESPRHQVFLNPFDISNRLATCGEFLQFINDGGYQHPQWWLSAGWQTVREEAWNAPLYWQRKDDRWWQFTLAGMQPIDLDAPVCHVSYFEADAYARWAGARLPTEAEWEIASSQAINDGRFADQLIRSGHTVHPSPIAAQVEQEAGSRQDFDPLKQVVGSCWQWTQSPYVAFPGYSPEEGALGEYNGKFMCGQYVLRGGSCATPSGHVRPTYRNFFPPEARWQFSGIRLARDSR